VTQAPLVSVIIPVYNGQKYLQQCLDSALAQTYAKLEILVVDDGSTDDSASMVEAIKDPRIRLLRQKNAGRCVARNRALRTATGDFVKYLDQDDLLDSEAIRLQVEDLQTEDEDVISCGRLKTFSSDVSSSNEFSFFHAFPRLCDPIQFYSLLGAHAVQTSLWLTPRSLHWKGGNWNEALPQNPMDDGELFMRILMKSRAVKYCQQSVAYHRLTDGKRGSNHDNPTKILSYFRSLELCSDQLLESENSARTREICARWLKHSLYMHSDFDAKLTARAFSKMTELGCPKVAYYLGGRLFRGLDRVFGLRFALLIRRYAKRFRPVVGNRPAGWLGRRSRHK
jgi:glycosyltransferase involved in cell wall biosynthesis